MDDRLSRTLEEFLNVVDANTAVINRLNSNNAALQQQVERLREMVSDTHYCEKLEHGKVCSVCEALETVSK